MTSPNPSWKNDLTIKRNFDVWRLWIIASVIDVLRHVVDIDFFRKLGFGDCLFIPCCLDYYCEVIVCHRKTLGLNINRVL